ncbi:hypothetical protein D9V37_17205 [Nocardioides mangrovicus]|uniref:Putative Flp pilus-assembly TadG-like N-terminal domain-containing protein n=1 Tax=Nocardioides mangrovicus TaxID=2478913 RepID=A0A3L8NXE2_9ACTN|nr:pilus assembly protein TadG-related protein [Nocardioides mangrovicus]RLV47855.1 hypothetical protein D9V37_17205 [Nocardioides mangrovicus]
MARLTARLTARLHRRDERGSLAPALPILAMMLLLLGGLGIDGSRLLNARGVAVAYAEEAARAGAQQVNLDSTTLELDPSKAYDAVRTYCNTISANSVGVRIHCTDIAISDGPGGHPLYVSVKVSGEIDTTLLQIATISHMNLSGSGRARPYEGITKPLDE